MQINWKSLSLYLFIMILSSSLMRMAGVPEVLRFGLMIMLIFIWPPFIKPN